MRYYDSIAHLYDAEYSEVTEDVEFYLQVIEEHGDPVLELGCGTGRVLIPIAKAGYEVWGLDASEKMLEVARRNVEKLEESVRKRIKLVRGDMRSFGLAKKFRTILVPFSTFLHLFSREEQESCLRCVREHLAEGGVFVVDVFAPRHDYLAKGEIFSLKKRFFDESGNEYFVYERSRYDNAKQIVEVTRFYDRVLEDGTVKRIVVDFKLRYVFRYELEYLLELNGFEVAAVYGWYDKRPYDYKSGKMIFLARKATR